MTASHSIHEGGEAFMRRALHFATREIRDGGGVVPIMASWLACYIVYRAGMSPHMIAALLDVDHEHVSRRIVTVIELFRVPSVKERVEALVEEYGQINFEVREDNVVRFPGPRQLAPHRTLEVVA